MINAKMLGMLAAAFVAGSFIASPELRAYAANTVFSTDIVDGQVKTADLAAAAVTAPKLGANSVNSAKIADGTVTAAEIATDGVGAAEIAANAVGASEIAANAVGASELANGAVNSAKIADNSITAEDIGPSEVGESEIGPNAVGASELQGVTKLMFIDCVKTIDLSIAPGNVVSTPCTAPGTDVDDLAIASHNGSVCFPVTKADSQAGYVSIFLFNRCSASQAVGTLTISIIVYDT